MRGYKGELIKKENYEYWEKQCYRCGGYYHKIKDCAHKSPKCFFCGGFGHITLMCRKANQQITRTKLEKEQAKYPRVATNNTKPCGNDSGSAVGKKIGIIATTKSIAFVAESKEKHGASKDENSMNVVSSSKHSSRSNEQQIVIPQITKETVAVTVQSNGTSGTTEQKHSSAESNINNATGAKDAINISKVITDVSSASAEIQEKKKATVGPTPSFDISSHIKWVLEDNSMYH